MVISTDMPTTVYITIYYYIKAKNCYCEVPVVDIDNH